MVLPLLPYHALASNASCKATNNKAAHKKPLTKMICNEAKCFLMTQWEVHTIPSSPLSPLLVVNYRVYLHFCFAYQPRNQIKVHFSAKRIRHTHARPIRYGMHCLDVCFKNSFILLFFSATVLNFLNAFNPLMSDSGEHDFWFLCSNPPTVVDDRPWIVSFGNLI